MEGAIGVRGLHRFPFRIEAHGTSTAEYTSSSLGTILGFAFSLGTAQNPLSGQHGVWAEDRERSV